MFIITNNSPSVELKIRRRFSVVVENQAFGESGIRWRFRVVVRIELESSKNWRHSGLGTNDLT